MDLYIRRTYFILRIVVALVLPPGSAYCEDAVVADNQAEWVATSASDVSAPQAAGESARLTPREIDEVDTLPQGKDLSRALWRWRFDEPRTLQDGVQSAPGNGTVGYALRTRTDAYADAFNTMSRFFRQVAMFAQSIKGDIDQGIAPVVQAIGSGFALGMHAPASSDPAAVLEHSGIFTEKYVSRFEPCLSFTFIFGS